MTIAENLLAKMSAGLGFSPKGSDAAVDLTGLDSLPSYGGGFEDEQIKEAARKLKIAPHEVRARLEAGETITWK